MFKVDLKIITIAFIFSIFQVKTLFAQNFSFNLTSISLNFNYTAYTDFTTSRTIVRAFTLNIINDRGRKDGDYNVYCKIVPSIPSAPTALFSVKVNGANFLTINPSFYLAKKIGLNDVLVANVTGRKKKTDIIYYDLILDPLPFTFDATLYNYNFVFTVVEII